MKTIKITFNDNSFSDEIKVKEITLKSEFDYDSEYKIRCEENNLYFKSKKEIDDFFEKTKRYNPNEFSIYFLKNENKSWGNSTFYELQSLKSLLLNFHWLQLSILNYKELDIKKMFYDEFIIDWNYNENSQNFIYLLKQSYTSDISNKKFLNKLIELNLLCKITLEIEEQVYNNYFIPLLTPGVNIEYFKSDFDNSGNITNRFWKNLLDEKSIRINNWLKNRY